MTRDHWGREGFVDRQLDRRPRAFLVSTTGVVWAILYLLAWVATRNVGYLTVSFPLTWLGTVAIFWRGYGRLRSDA